MGQSIGIFGGTFDPVHLGHVRIAEAFLESERIQKLWVMLTPDPPHKQGKGHAPFVYREQMLEKAFADHEQIEISTIENTLPRPTYTIQTLEFLTKNYPTEQFYLCIGEDSLVNFTEWYRYNDILGLVDLIVAHRPGFDSSDVDDSILNQTHFIEHEPVDISSSEIRETIAKGETADEHLPKSISAVIQENQLYMQDRE